MPPAMVVFHRLANKEYAAARRWYRKQSLTAEPRFRAEVGRVVQLLSTAPQQGGIYQGPYRWIQLYRFPWVLYYEILDSATVIVYALAHARRRPGYWMRRVHG